MGDYTPVYLNELLYMDWILASIIDQLKESSLLDKTLVIITNDHGEMLGEQAHPIGHGWAFTPELANTPLLIMDPQNPGCHVNYTIGSQVDLLPTVLDRLHLVEPNGQLYEGYSLDSKTRAKDRQIYMNTMQQFGILEGDHVFVGDRESGGNLGPGSKGSVFKVSNQGTKTLFTADLGASRGISISAFDGFQENFLRNYEHYAQLAAGR
jgi:membrane-anchored protein YejM (alkaline phosphatase superfamily)